MMGIVQRRKAKNNQDEVENLLDESKTASYGGKEYNVIKSIVLAIILTAILYCATTMMKSSQVDQQMKGDAFAVSIDFAKDETGSKYSLGIHQVAVSILNTCTKPKIWLRIVGDALVDVPLSKSKAMGTSDWLGSFTVPMEGSYKVEARWKGCEGGDSTNEVKQYEFRAAGKAAYSPKDVGGVSFTDGAWIAADKIKANKDIKASPSFSSQYLWADPAKVIEGKEMTVLEGREKSIVLKESTVTDDVGFYAFQQLSNYEVVCWVGSKSAEDIWGSFKALRAQVFPHQRPFKFHYYPATSFVDPDKDWKDNNYVRKCKHILVSLDEPEEPLSQMEYKEQVTTFIKHLLNAFDEEHTFPALIWMFTTMESPIDAKNCHDTFMERTTDHPCNDVLKDMFKSSPFPSRVRLLDNTDLTSVKMGEDRESVLAAVALRIFVFVGHQVKAWRDIGQSGGIEGLTKNGVTEPNYELVRYDWTQKLDAAI
jgi:hypothetical protein